MEKCGTGYPRVRRAGLLTARGFVFWPLCLVCFLCAGFVFPQETEMILSQPPYTAGEPFSLSFVFYGVDPEDVRPAGSGASGEFFPHGENFPDSFTAESVRKTLSFFSRTGKFAGHPARAAVVSLDIRPEYAGDFVLGPFSFRAGNRQVSFAPLRITVEAPRLSLPEKTDGSRLEWRMQSGGKWTAPENLPSVPAGQEVLLALFVPEGVSGSLSCPVPEDTLLVPDTIPETAAGDSRTGAGDSLHPAAVYRWTPLLPGVISLPRAVLTPESGTPLVSGTPSVLVRPAPNPDSSALSGGNAQAAGAETGTPAAENAADGRTDGQDSRLSGPEKPAALSVQETDPPLAAGLAAACSALWDAGEYPQVAVMLRAAAGSRLFFASRLAEMRDAAEDALGVHGSSSGWLSRLVFFLPFACFPAAVACAVCFALRGKKVSGRPVNPGRPGRKAAAVSGVLFLLCGTLSLACRAASGGIRETAASGGVLFRIPDTGAEAVTRLRPGEALRVRGTAPGWLRAETLSGESGWYPLADAVVYQSGDLNEFR